MQPKNNASEESYPMQVDGPPRGRGRPKRTWMEVVTIYRKKCNQFAYLAQEKQNSRSGHQHSWTRL